MIKVYLCIIEKCSIQLIEFNLTIMEDIGIKLKSLKIFS